jgi:hypothetical protein
MIVVPIATTYAPDDRLVVKGHEIGVVKSRATWTAVLKTSVSAHISRDRCGYPIMVGPPVSELDIGLITSPNKTNINKAALVHNQLSTTP